MGYLRRLTPPVGRAVLREDARSAVSSASVGVGVLRRVGMAVGAMGSERNRMARIEVSFGRTDFRSMFRGLRSSIASALRNHIRRVRRYVSNEQVVGAHTERRVAVVAGHLTWSQGNPGPFESQTVNVQGSTATLYNPVTATSSGSLPEPASICLLDLRPEPRFDWFGVASHAIHCTASAVR